MINHPQCSVSLLLPLTIDSITQTPHQLKAEVFASLSTGSPQNLTMDSDHSVKPPMYLLHGWYRWILEKNFFSWNPKRLTLTPWFTVKPIKLGRERQMREKWQAERPSPDHSLLLGPSP